MNDDEYERKDRILLRPWLENMLESGSIPGLDWYNEEKTMFKIAWKHRSKKDWSMRHSGVFLEWAKNTGRWSEGDPPPNFAQLKTRLRCAFNKAPDIEEMRDFHVHRGEEPYKVYKFYARKAKLPPVKSFSKTFMTTNARVLHQWSDSPPPGRDDNNCVEELAPFDEDKYYTEDEVRLSSPRSTSVRNRTRENMFIGSPAARINKDDIRSSASSSSRDYYQSTPSFSTSTSNIPISVEQMTSCSSSDSESNSEAPRAAHPSKSTTADDFSPKMDSFSQQNRSYYSTLEQDVIYGNLNEGSAVQPTEHWVGGERVVDPRLIRQTMEHRDRWSKDRPTGYVPSMPDIVPHSLASSRSSVADALMERNELNAAPSPAESRLYLLGVASMFVEEVDRKRLEMEEEAVRLSNCTTPVGETSQMVDSPSITCALEESQQRGDCPTVGASPYYQTGGYSEGMQTVEMNNVVTQQSRAEWGEYSPQDGFSYATPTQVSEMEADSSDIETLRREFKEKEQLLVVKAKMLLEEEERLQAWERELLNKQEELNQRERCLESAIKAKSDGMEDFRSDSSRAGVYGYQIPRDTNSTQNCESLLSKDYALSEKGEKNVGQYNDKLNSSEHPLIQLVRQSIATSIMHDQNRVPVSVSRPRLVATVIRANSMNFGAPHNRVPFSEPLRVTRTSTGPEVSANGRPPLILERLSVRPREGGGISQMPLKASNAAVSSFDAQRPVTIHQRILRLPSNSTTVDKASNQLTLSIGNIRPYVDLSVSNAPTMPSSSKIDNKNDADLGEKVFDSIGSAKFVTSKTKEKKAPTIVKSIMVHPFREITISPQCATPTTLSAVYSVAKSMNPLKETSGGDVISMRSTIDSSLLRNEKKNGSGDVQDNQSDIGYILKSDLDIRIDDNISCVCNPNDFDATVNRLLKDAQQISDDTILSNAKEFVSRADEQRWSNVSSPSNGSLELTKIMDVSNAVNSAGHSSFTDWLREKTEKICNRDVRHDASFAIAPSNLVRPKEAHVVLSKSPVKTCSSPVKNLIREKLGCMLNLALESTSVRIESDNVKNFNGNISLIGDNFLPSGETSSNSNLTPKITSLTLCCDDTIHEKNCHSTNNDLTKSPALIKFIRLPAVMLNNFLNLIDPILLTGFMLLVERTFTLWKTSLAVGEARTIDEDVLHDSTSDEFCADANMTFNDDNDEKRCLNEQADESSKLMKEPFDSKPDGSEDLLKSRRHEAKSDTEVKSRSDSPVNYNTTRKRRFSDKADDNNSSKFKSDKHAIGGRWH